MHLKSLDRFWPLSGVADGVRVAGKKGRQAMAKRKQDQQQYPWEQIEGATGASDATSGGGAGAGNPDPETIERTGGRVLKGDVKEDKKRLFPERIGKTTRKGAASSKKSSGAKSKRAAARKK
jgi:hypothetical protein